MPTRREIIAAELRDRPVAVRDLAQLLGMRVKDLVDDLEHLRRSYGKAFVVEPAECSGCGFVFKARERLSTPSRCPKCKDERLRGPWVGLRDS